MKLCRAADQGGHTRCATREGTRCLASRPGLMCAKRRGAVVGTVAAWIEARAGAFLRRHTPRPRAHPPDTRAPRARRRASGHATLATCARALGTHWACVSARIKIPHAHARARARARTETHPHRRLARGALAALNVLLRLQGAHREQSLCRRVERLRRAAAAVLPAPPPPPSPFPRSLARNRLACLPKRLGMPGERSAAARMARRSNWAGFAPFRVGGLKFARGHGRKLLSDADAL